MPEGAELFARRLPMNHQLTPREMTQTHAPNRSSDYSRSRTRLRTAGAPARAAADSPGVEAVILQYCSFIIAQRCIAELGLGEIRNAGCDLEMGDPGSQGARRRNHPGVALRVRCRRLTRRVVRGNELDHSPRQREPAHRIVRQINIDGELPQSVVAHPATAAFRDLLIWTVHVNESAQ